MAVLLLAVGPRTVDVSLTLNNCRQFLPSFKNAWIQERLVRCPDTACRSVFIRSRHVAPAGPMPESRRCRVADSADATRYCSGRGMIKYGSTAINYVRTPPAGARTSYGSPNSGGTGSPGCWPIEPATTSKRSHSVRTRSAGRVGIDHRVRARSRGRSTWRRLRTRP